VECHVVCEVNIICYLKAYFQKTEAIFSINRRKWNTIDALANINNEFSDASYIDYFISRLNHPGVYIKKLLKGNKANNLIELKVYLTHLLQCQSLNISQTYMTNGSHYAL